ncbi:MAG: nucleoside-diphosphate sugar epimerase [Gammaproteobacteria bacterium]|nr:nucleoside-diphosphate sugar epimerase [Gammaproteobacteria bacterium]NIR81919.1 nucleoside-diphosphate sugar epimerase [Gammaproteobacteria bacterium]NIR88751.1 nucleoside-diphosphate sugar epimerase [Gammaproteobacteria bacterium]NIU03027.1 nucleoside-diphosphate sugar epimerase [Gammaproteobacteria bacterium]NIV50548.1 nucleoside-diphosphate sugar epimerase [Gammaproteobacteria bacterium]
MLNLARALGWPYETKQLVYNPLNHCPNVLLGASLASVERRRCAPLEPPWPDLVIAASRRSAPVAQWIKRQSAGRARLVHLLHAQAPLDRFDLIITTPQYRLPQRPNVLHNVAPLNPLDHEALTAAGRRWAPRFEHLPRPWIGLMVGGDSSSYRLSATAAARLGREAARHARAAGGSLLVSTSPRTPAAAAEAVLAHTREIPAYRYRWRPEDAGNPYLAYLALADEFIVTVDSASLVVEACATGRPVYLFAWPRRTAQRFGLAVSRYLLAAPGFARLHRALVYWGFVKPARDFEAYHRALEARGLLRRLGERAAVSPRGRLDDMERAISRVRALMVQADSPGPDDAR